MTPAKPSHGSLICTFADCPDRIESIRNPEFRDMSMIELGFCPLGARVTDYSICQFPDKAAREPCDSGGIFVAGKWYPRQWNPLYCEIRTRYGTCPRGFTR